MNLKLILKGSANNIEVPIEDVKYIRCGSTIYKDDEIENLSLIAGKPTTITIAFEEKIIKVLNQNILLMIFSK